MSGDLLIPGRRRGTAARVGQAIEELHDLYLYYHHTSCGPFKMLRLDRYFWELENALTFMRPTKGGSEWDNRRAGGSK